MIDELLINNRFIESLSKIYFLRKRHLFQSLQLKTNQQTNQLKKKNFLKFEKNDILKHFKHLLISKMSKNHSKSKSKELDF